MGGVEVQSRWDMPGVEEAPPIRVAPPAYSELRVKLFQALGYPLERRPLIIGADGRDGMGKSSLANWLAWQLGMSNINLDHYMISGSEPLVWHLDELNRVFDAHQELGRPVVVEGIFLQDCLAQAGKKIDYLIFVLDTSREPWGSLRETLDDYFERWQPAENANFTVTWSSEAYDRLHYEREMQRRSK